jgi:hypothetical protein
MSIIFVTQNEMRKLFNLIIFNLVILYTLNHITNILPHLITELNAIKPFINYGALTCKIITALEFVSIRFNV